MIFHGVDQINFRPREVPRGGAEIGHAVPVAADHGQFRLAVDPAAIERYAHEPSLGIAPILVQEIFAQVRKINEQGVAVLVVEQNASVAMDVASYGYVMENGNISIEGPTEVLRADPRVQEAYLGVVTTK